jgi:hypothetical protein
MNTLEWRNTPDEAGLILVDGSGPVTGADGNSVRISFADAEAEGLALRGRSAEAQAPEAPEDPVPPDEGGRPDMGPNSGAGAEEPAPSTEENTATPEAPNSNQPGEAPSGGKQRGMAAQYYEEFSRSGALFDGIGSDRSEEEIAEARQVARLLAVRLDGDPRDPDGPPPEYRQVAFVPILLAAGVIGAEEAWILLTLFVGTVVATQLLRGNLGSSKPETGRAAARPPIPPGKAFPGAGGKADADSHQPYQLVADDLIKIWTKPLYSRGNKWTQEGNDIVVQQCLDVLNTEYPDLIGLINHIGGATVKGEGGTKVPELYKPGQNAQNPRSNSSRPDTSFGGRFGGVDFAAHINTAAMNRRGDWTSWERFSLARLIRNVGKDFVAAVRKLKKDDDREEYAHDVREACRDAMNALQDRLNELKKKQGENEGNGEEDQQPEQGKEE